MTEAAYIVAARRAPIGRLCGAYTGMAAARLGAQVMRAVIDDAGIDPAIIDEVIAGQVLQGGAGQNPARQAAIYAGIPDHVPAMTVNKVCGAGQKSIHLASQSIRAGDAHVILASGQDSMTEAPHLLPGVRTGRKMGDMTAKDMMIVDGLWDVFNDIHMGRTVESLAGRYQITREEQDRFALASQQKALAAREAGRFEAEITPITIPDRKGDRSVQRDEQPRETTLERLSGMAPAFDREGTITPGNASGLNDGASAVLVVSETKLRELGLKPMARIASYAAAALDPMDMGLGPVEASRKALEKAGWAAQDLDRMEINEAFAAQSLAVNREMDWDPAAINVNGGAIALGHPLAASGNRIVTTLVHEMARSGTRKGLASLCIGGGMGVAICLERA
ncbi:acetyl-CoA C-acetyltransferase [Rhodovulum sulfidophilum]|uniref:Acetyl-CoA C-acetyltransferase n=1 Tax=Rhodovulum sulfidophilum TaxID=35806 RepID=A0ABS1RW41_RHOSU|nr:acetyl-CoA C-acetyltransferase [Rhodovulum sulfidophilum]MBL3610307.1 acetyl-CoA C-acetyltransferase [Rhodovulum sulfidophilum]MCE8456377.1 acetyl-CoA C-acetyltransferase [Rhodovulum sulfidophilum]